MSETASKSGGSTSALIVRVVLLGVLAGAVTLLVLDRTAGSQCDAAYKRVKAELAPAAGGKTLEVSAERIQELVGFKAQQTDETRQQDHFYFSAPTRKYRLTVSYAGGAIRKLAQECDKGIGAPGAAD